MPEYPPGTPCWVDLFTPDPDAAAAFYKELFGWETQVDESEQTEGYRTFRLDGKAVAGLSRPMAEGQPPSWATYISVEDADASAAKISEAGGQVLAEPMQVLEYGRMAVFADPTGAVCSIWQPGEHTGAEIVNEPGSLCWNELATPEPDNAKDFYRAVFGWETEPMDDTYTLFTLGGKTIAGLMGIDTQATWGVCFAVADTDAVTAKVESAGGTVAVPGMDTPIGRYAIYADPAGVSFAIITLSQQPAEAGEAQTVG